MEQKTTIIDKKEHFIKAFPKLNFNISKTCREVGIDRKRYYKWVENKVFKEKLKAAVEKKKDMIEDKLYEEAMNGNIAALIFLAKTQLKDRGYIEKQEIEHTGKIFDVTITRVNGEDKDKPKTESQTESSVGNS